LDSSKIEKRELERVLGVSKECSKSSGRCLGSSAIKKYDLFN
jgi:hypothetical protein